MAVPSRRATTVTPHIKKRIDNIGGHLVEGFQLVALFVIGGTIVWSAILEYTRMMDVMHASLEDILLLFIYLELGAMVGIYFKTDRLPVRFLLYIAITVLTRFLAVDVKELTNEKILIITGAILLLTLAILILQVTASKFPKGDVE
jgi:phosphate starvation-inducible membrane PsiE